jgi:hypothetical protein
MPTTCNNTSGYFQRHNYSLTSRALLFFLICIPVRTSLGVLLWFFVNHPDTQLPFTILTFLAGLYVIQNTIRCRHDRVWWSREFEALIGISLIIFCILIWTQQIPENTHPFIAVPIWIDAFVGVILFLHTQILSKQQ